MGFEIRKRIWQGGDEVSQAAFLLAATDPRSLAGNMKELLSHTTATTLAVELGLGRLLFLRNQNYGSWVSAVRGLLDVLWGDPALRPWLKRLYAEVFRSVEEVRGHDVSDLLEIWSLRAAWNDRRMDFGIMDWALTLQNWTGREDVLRRLEAPVFVHEAQYERWRAANAA